MFHRLWEINGFHNSKIPKIITGFWNYWGNPAILKFKFFYGINGKSEFLKVVWQKKFNYHTFTYEFVQPDFKIRGWQILQIVINGVFAWAMKGILVMKIPLSYPKKHVHMLSIRCVYPSDENAHSLINGVLGISFT